MSSRHEWLRSSHAHSTLSHPTTRRSSSAATSPRPRARANGGRRGPSRVAVLRRRAALAFLAVLVVVIAVPLVKPLFQTAVQEIALPLKHEDIIRQQAADKGLDPALVAGVIYTESRFRDGQTSSAGAQGLMQLTPATAKYIAGLSGGTAFVLSDLDVPQVNISYGTYYLRYLLNRYDGSEPLALAAYNGGEGNVDAWVAREKARGRDFTTDRIPFTETRQYVTKVMTAQRQYQDNYGSELGL